jgi:hypothetical protein
MHHPLFVNQTNLARKKSEAYFHVMRICIFSSISYPIKSPSPLNNKTTFPRHYPSPKHLGSDQLRMSHLTNNTQDTAPPKSIRPVQIILEDQPKQLLSRPAFKPDDNSKSSAKPNTSQKHQSNYYLKPVLPPSAPPITAALLSKPRSFKGTSQSIRYVKYKLTWLVIKRLVEMVLRFIVK